MIMQRAGTSTGSKTGPLGALPASFSGELIRYLDEGSVFTIRRTSDWYQDRRDGKCTIRVRIDDDSDVGLRGVLRGGPGPDEGSECNAPLPVCGNIRNFRLRGIDGRGNPRLVQSPSIRNYYVAVLNVQDPQGGGFFPNRPTTRPTPPSGGGNFPDQPTTRPVPLPMPGDNSLQDMNALMAGNGTLDDGTQSYNMTDASVHIRGD